MYRLSFKITFILIHKDEYHFLAIHNIFKLKRYFVVNIIFQKGQKKTTNNIQNSSANKLRERKSEFATSEKPAIFFG